MSVSIEGEEMKYNSFMFVSDGDREVKLCFLDDRRIVFIDSYNEENPILLDTQEKAFEEVKSPNPFLKMGNPAGWISRVIKSGMLEELAVKSKVESH